VKSHSVHHSSEGSSPCRQPATPTNVMHAFFSAALIMQSPAAESTLLAAVPDQTSYREWKSTRCTGGAKLRCTVECKLTSRQSYL